MYVYMYIYMHTHTHTHTHTGHLESGDAAAKVEELKRKLLETNRQIKQLEEKQKTCDVLTALDLYQNELGQEGSALAGLLYLCMYVCIYNMYYAYIFDIYTHMQEYMYVCICVCVCVYIYIIYKIYIRYLCIRYLYIHGTYLRVLAFLRICAWAEREELRRELKLREANYTVAKEKFDKLDKEYKEYAEKHKQVHIFNKKKFYSLSWVCILNVPAQAGTHFHKYSPW